MFYEKLIKRLQVLELLKEFNNDPTRNILFVHRSVIGHPLSILVARNRSTGEYEIFELLHKYRDGQHGKKAIIGKGCFGVVVNARNAKTGEIVAVKKMSQKTVIPEEKFDFQASYRIYEKVAAIQAECAKQGANCPLIPLYASGFSSDSKGIVSLYAIMAKGKCDFTDWRTVAKLTVQERLQIIRDVFDLIFLIFSNNLDFCDFHSGNCLLDYNNRFRLCDLESLEESNDPIPSFMAIMKSMGSLLPNYYDDSCDNDLANLDRVCTGMKSIVNQRSIAFLQSKEHLALLCSRLIDKYAKILQEDGTLETKTMMTREQPQLETYSELEVQCADLRWSIQMWNLQEVESILRDLFKFGHGVIAVEVMLEQISPVDNFVHDSLSEYANFIKCYQGILYSEFLTVVNKMARLEQKIKFLDNFLHGNSFLRFVFLWPHSNGKFFCDESPVNKLVIWCGLLCHDSAAATKTKHDI
jgi:hypothetical protein